MNQVKIGKFIANRRKENNLTQMQLAEMLNVTDRAVSKWETGKSMPDSSIMIELCNVLKITVNDLLSGEIIQMENYNKELENKLIELVKEKENKDRHLLTLEWVIGVLSILVLFIPIFIGLYLPIEKEWVKIVIMLSGVIPCLVGLFFAMKIEQVAGYYECKHCGNRYVPSFKAINFSMHLGRTRFLKCPKCGKCSWQKKVITKEE